VQRIQYLPVNIDATENEVGRLGIGAGEPHATRRELINVRVVGWRR
jgi:hypothetical protein